MRTAVLTTDSEHLTNFRLCHIKWHADCPPSIIIDETEVMTRILTFRPRSSTEYKLMPSTVVTVIELFISFIRVRILHFLPSTFINIFCIVSNSYNTFSISLISSVVEYCILLVRIFTFFIPLICLILFNLITCIL